MASSRKRVAAAANYDSGEDMPDLVVAGPSGGPALYLQPPVLQAERSSSESSEGQEEEGGDAGDDDEEALDDASSDGEYEDDDDLVAGQEWSNILTPVQRDQFVQNLVGPVHGLPPTASALDYFFLFFDLTFFEAMVLHTNAYAARVRAAAVRAAAAGTGSAHRNPWTETNVPEMRAYVGLHIATGLKGIKEMDDIWSSQKYFRDSDLAGVIPRNRYWALNRYVHIVDDTTMITDRTQPGYDPLYKVRNMINLANTRFAEIYKPQQHLSVDESMVKFDGRHMSKQYMPKKPIKWGFKFWMLAEASSGYCLRVEMYEGKLRGAARNAIVKSHGLGYDVVDTLTKEYQQKNHIVYYDRFFSSVKLAEDLLSKATYTNSTVMLNRKGLPAAMKRLKLKKGAACRQKMKGQLLLTVFIDKRQVSHLSTGIAPGLVQNSLKPIVNEDYNAHMGGVDLADQHKSYYSVGRKARRWWKYIMWYIFTLSIKNAHLVRQASNITGLSAADRSKHLKQTHKQFRRDLVELLIDGYEGRHRVVGTGFKRVIPACAVMSPAAAITHICELAAEQRVCFYCARKGDKAPKGGSIRTKGWCSQCEKHLCPVGCFSRYHLELCTPAP